MGTTEKKEEFVLTPEALETFRQKTFHSIHILPACWGGYDANDELCQNCSLTFNSHTVLVNIAEAAKRVNENETFLAIRGYGGPFFAVHSGSCIEKRQELQSAVYALEAANKIRKERMAIKNITRMPKGEVREGHAPFDYVKYYSKDGLWVRLGKHSEKFPYSCGVLYRFDGLETLRGKPTFRSDRIVGCIGSISKPPKTDYIISTLFKPKKDNDYFLVFPKRQTEAQGSLAMEATRKGKDGKGDETLYIVLQTDSYEKVSAKFDDLGRLS